VAPIPGDVNLTRYPTNGAFPNARFTLLFEVLGASPLSKSQKSQDKKTSASKKK